MFHDIHIVLARKVCVLPNTSDMNIVKHRSYRACSESAVRDGHGTVSFQPQCHLEAAVFSFVSSAGAPSTKTKPCTTGKKRKKPAVLQNQVSPSVNLARSCGLSRPFNPTLTIPCRRHLPSLFLLLSPRRLFQDPLCNLRIPAVAE